MLALRSPAATIASTSCLNSLLYFLWFLIFCSLHSI